MKPGMKLTPSRLRSFALALGSTVLIIAFNNCHLEAIAPTVGNTVTGTITGAGTGPKPPAQGTETGNPFYELASKAILTKTCEVIRSAHPELTQDACQAGASKTSFASALGVPDYLLNPYRLLLEAELAKKITADPTALANCLADLNDLSSQNTLVASAYQAETFNPFNNLATMMPTRVAGCQQVFKGNSFATRTLTPETNTHGGTTTTFLSLDSDTQKPTGKPGTSLTGVFADLNLDSGGNLGWSTPFDADTTNSLFLKSTGATLTFINGPRFLQKIDFYATEPGTVTVVDNLEQSATLLIPADSQMHTLELNFPQPSSSFRIEFPKKLKLGIDNIVYQERNEI